MQHKLKDFIRFCHAILSLDPCIQKKELEKKWFDYGSQQFLITNLIGFIALEKTWISTQSNYMTFLLLLHWKKKSECYTRHSDLQFIFTNAHEVTTVQSIWSISLLLLYLLEHGNCEMELWEETGILLKDANEIYYRNPGVFEAVNLFKLCFFVNSKYFSLKPGNAPTTHTEMTFCWKFYSYYSQEFFYHCSFYQFLP